MQTFAYNPHGAIPKPGVTKNPQTDSLNFIRWLEALLGETCYWELEFPKTFQTLSEFPFFLVHSCTSASLTGRGREEDSTLHVHCVVSGQSWYFVKQFWNVPLAVWLIQDLLCSPIGNRNLRKKTKQNIATKRTPHSVQIKCIFIKLCPLEW